MPRAQTAPQLKPARRKLARAPRLLLLLLWLVDAGAALAASPPPTSPGPLPATVVWRFPGEAVDVRATAGPLLFRGHAVVGLDDGRLVGLAVVSGEPVFSIATGLRPLAIASDRELLLVLGPGSEAPAGAIAIAAFALPAEAPVWRRTLDASSLAAVAAGDGVLVVAESPHGLRAYETGTGGLLWALADWAPAAAAPLIAAGAVYLPGPEGLEKRALSTGELVWTRLIPNGTSARPALVAERLFVASSDGYLHGLDDASGDVRWSLDLGAKVTAPILAYRESAIVATWAGQLVRVKRNGHPLWRAPLDGRSLLAPELWEGAAVLVVTQRSAAFQVIDGERGSPFGAPGLGGWQEWLESVPLVAEEHFVARTSRRQLVAFGPAPPAPPTSAISGAPPAEAAAPHESASPQSATVDSDTR